MAIPQYTCMQGRPVLLFYTVLILLIMFISVIDGYVDASISRERINNTNKDEITLKYRNTATYGNCDNPLKELQNKLVSWCNEMPCASGDNLCIQDVFIDESCQDEQYTANLKQLIQNNKHIIKSVYIDMPGIKNTPYNNVQKVVEYFELKDLKNIVKIYCLLGEDTESIYIIPVLNKQVKCLQLVCGFSFGSLLEKVTSLQELEVIDIYKFRMSHSELRLLYDFVSQRVDMRQIVLWDLECSDHGSSCSGLSLDLSRHLQLRNITLDHIPQPQLNINMTSLERCDLSMLSLSFLVFTHGTCDTVNSELHRSDVCFCEVTIPASVLKDLVTVIQTFPQTVCVDKVKGCDIEPKTEWEILKQQIKTSQHFTVLEEDGDGQSKSSFKFETIKHGN